MNLFELRKRYAQNYLTFAGKNSKDFLLYLFAPIPEVARIIKSSILWIRFQFCNEFFFLSQCAAAC